MLIPLACSCSPAFFSKVPPPTELYTLSLHDALPIYPQRSAFAVFREDAIAGEGAGANAIPVDSPIVLWLNQTGRVLVKERSGEHTSELQSPDHLVCRLLLEKKNHTAEDYDIVWC